MKCNERGQGMAKEGAKESPSEAPGTCLPSVHELEGVVCELVKELLVGPICRRVPLPAIQLLKGGRPHAPAPAPPASSIPPFLASLRRAPQTPQALQDLASPGT